MAHALVVEDDADSAMMMAAMVARSGFTASTASSLDEARRMLAQRRPDIVLLDLQLPDGSGMALLDDAELLASAPVVMVTGHGSLSSSVDAMRRGAADYLVKPVDRTRLQEVLSRCALPSASAGAARADLPQQPGPAARPERLIGSSPAMVEVRRQIAQVAPTQAPVLLSGESGTGKELAALALHAGSRRAAAPFLAVNCGALPVQLAESALFGHERGSFTGAERQHQGLFEQAHGGTLFLDEVTELPLGLQVKLMRVLEDGSFMRLGSNRTRQTDVRIVAASNRDPRVAVGEGRLLADLYWRLGVFEIQLPPLRERREDIPAIAQQLLAQIAQREGREKRLAPQTIAALSQRAWPGNVRELRNVLYRAWISSPGDVVVPGSLPAVRPWPNEKTATDKLISPGLSLAEAERLLVLATWEHCHHNREQTASVLGISAKSLYNRLRAYKA
ncbi:response regulator [Xylophilus rhododendri]|uniref:Response regulator n=1 Tax=Xylophilus rhododendri TaxID=2697032 RepID=A0A857J0N4_9BURK|nr:sigma-54 dependent transcriptional regulator [Xylophilus rhododendri]QHI96833.1 response regulator [Xylophilus rhododendri]